MKTKKKTINTYGIFIGFIAGSIIGLVFNHLKPHSFFGPIIEIITNNVFYPVGNAFLQALFMVIVPLIFSSLIVGVSDFGNPKSIGRLSKRLFLFYACSTIIAIFIGQSFMISLKPGQNIKPEKAQEIAITMKAKMSSLKEKSSMVGDSLWPGIITKIIPRNIISQFGENNMLAVIFVSLLFGLALLYMPSGSSKNTFIEFMSTLSNISIVIIGWIMKLAPYAVTSLLAIAVSEFGLSLMKSMLFYISVMIMGMLCHLFITYSIFLKFLIKIPLKEFYKRMVPIFTTSFSTSSSSATMPVTMSTLEKKFGVPRSIVNFSVPIGTVVNMDGTALFEVAATIFIAQIFGIDLTLTSYLLLIAIVFITSVGIAGVPGGSIPILMSAIVVLGIPPEGIAVILGVDRLLDMGRTTVNVTGDSIAALYLAKKENINISEKIKTIPL